jgi:ATP-dependent exoDNAse (exonuclease V) alpha subunit
MTKQTTNPFQIGDKVVFAPNDHALGWSCMSLDKFRIYPGDAGTISKISDDSYLYIEDDRGGFHWECWQPWSEAAELKHMERWQSILDAENEKVRKWRAKNDVANEIE